MEMSYSRCGINQRILCSVLFASFVFVPMIDFVDSTIPDSVPTLFGIETDRLALLNLKTHLIDGPGGVLSSWNSSLHFCSWGGVTCGRRHQRVTVLNLTGQGISGYVSPSIGNLTFLRTLDFSINKLQGIIPKEIGRLYRLEHLDMYSNLLQGNIPTEITNCSRVNYLDLSHNNLTGKVPFTIGSMSKIQFLVLELNNLAGVLPSSLGNHSLNQVLALGRNSFRGSIPGELGSLKGLTWLSLDNNILSGSILSPLYNLSSITSVSLTNNRLSGTLHPDLGLSWPNLQAFTFGLNQFTGAIPLTVSNLSGLQIFDGSFNYLTGEVFQDWGKLRHLTRLSLGNNSLGTGTFSDTIFLSSLANSTSSSLRLLDMELNEFGGTIPNSITNLSNLDTLVLSGNQLQGSIPEGIGNLKNLTGLYLDSNRFTGLIPSSIANLRNLVVLYINENQLSGPIPFSIGNLTALIHLDMQYNQLDGIIPLSLKYCTNLQFLTLNQNGLSGAIPAEAIGNLKSIVSLNLDHNVLTGSFPKEIGFLKNLENLSISDNRFSGQIPDELGSCELLSFLSMAGNSFEGNIPQSLSSLRGIQEIDLSRNNLSGDIPRQLEDLRALRSLNLSFNKLEGEIPLEGVFKIAAAVSLTGNKRFCGGVPELKFPPCSVPQSSKDGKRRISTKMLIIVIIVCLAFLFIVVSLAVVVICKRKVRKGGPSGASSMKMVYMRISYKEILEATGGFASFNLIGEGSFGSVYRGVLAEEERPVAIKVINVERRGAAKSFEAECKALSKIRHRNLVKIRSCCSSVDYQGNDFLALVFELMPNGNLDSWLHGTRSLSLAQRLDIAIDIASAVSYLHHQCDPRIVHCDLKPQNVLIDENMVARVGDFGLAKLLGDCNSDASRNYANSSALKGSIGYIAPEYGIYEGASPKADVFSYGIMLLEMITGKRPTDETFGDHMNLHTLVKTALPDGIRHILDLPLQGELEGATNNVAGLIAELGVACSAESPAERMDVEDVLKQLERIKKKLSVTIRA